MTDSWVTTHDARTFNDRVVHESIECTILDLMNGKKRVKYLVLKALIMGLQIINMMIWFWYTLMGILFLPKAITKEGYFPYIWTFAVCITMVSVFLLTLSCYRDSFNVVSVIIGIVSFLILIYIMGGILLSTGLARPSEEVQFPLVRYYLVFIAFWMVIKVIA